MTKYFTDSQTKESLLVEKLGKEILNTEPFDRLKRISFLGILNTVAGIPDELRFTRYDHSISVAFLTWKYCTNLGVPEEVTLTATLLALIHDVAHPPYSHSTELYIIRRAGARQTHSTVLTSEKIAGTLKASYESLPNQIKRKNLGELANLLWRLSNRNDRRDYHPALENMFDTPFCPDTFDGVNRAWFALKSTKTTWPWTSSRFRGLNPMDPKWLIDQISITRSPLVFESKYPPPTSNPVSRFHELMRALYYDVIYSPWQTGAMVMFARAEEIVYSKIEDFSFTKIDDEELITNLRNNLDSLKLLQHISKGPHFERLSSSNPELLRAAWEIFYALKDQGVLVPARAELIEETIAQRLQIKKEKVYCHIYQPYIWSSKNIKFEKVDPKEIPHHAPLCKISWQPSEGNPEFRPSMEIYYERPDLSKLM